jgi:carbon-monoxide dehydrogenase medium subunit
MRTISALQQSNSAEVFFMRFGYFEPSSVEEAIDILRRGKDSHKVVAGGTDVIINLRRRTKSYSALVNIKRLPGITSWSAEPGKGLHIGAATPFRDLETSAPMIERFPALVESIKVIGSVQLRNLATIGGNLCNASPSADSAPSLMVAGATATFVNDGDGTRTIPVDQFFSRPGQSILGPVGLLLRVDVPEPQGMTGNCFERFTPRHAMDIAIASVASQVTLEPASGKVEDVAIALGAVAPTPIRVPRAEETLRGREPTPDLLAKAGAMAKEECAPIDDIRGTAAYRRAMIEVLVRRTLARAIERARARAGS